METYTKLDIKEIAYELGEHFNKHDLDGYTGRCVICNTRVGQQVNECPGCGTPVVWLNSSVWTSLFGSGKMRVRELDAVPANCTSGKQLLSRCRALGFANLKERDDWTKFDRRFGQAEAERVIEYVFKADKTYGRGAMAHAMAIARKKLRENPLSTTIKREDTVTSMKAWQE